VTCERGGVDHRTYEPISGPGRSRHAASPDRRASPSAQPSGRAGTHSERLPTVEGGTRVTPVPDGVPPTGRRREFGPTTRKRGDPSSCRSSTRAAAVTAPAARRTRTRQAGILIDEGVVRRRDVEGAHLNRALQRAGRQVTRRHAVFLDHRRVGMREGAVLSHGRSRTNRQLRPGAGASRAT